MVAELDAAMQAGPVTAASLRKIAARYVGAGKATGMVDRYLVKRRERGEVFPAREGMETLWRLQ